MANIICCCCEDGKTARTFIYYSIIGGLPSEFISCNSPKCNASQFMRASAGKCSMRCDANVDHKWTLQMLIKNQDCGIERGCSLSCRLHIDMMTNWMFCSYECKRAFSKQTAMANAPNDMIRVQICAGCSKEHINGKLPRCGRCKLTVYCNTECQKLHWTTHRNTCVSNK